MKFIQIIPIEETYLRIFEKPAKVRFSKQVVSVNYGSLSPFTGGDHLFCQYDAALFVWYLKEMADKEAFIHIPEAYLAWRFFKERKNALILLPRKGFLSFLLIQDGVLRAQIIRNTCEGEGEVIDLLKREYSLNQVEIIRLAPTVTFKISLHDLVTFADIDIKPTNLFETTISLLKIPLIAALLITSGFYMYSDMQLESHFVERKKYLAKIKLENGDLQSSLEQLREQSSYWRDFISKEQAYPDYYQLLAALTNLVKQNGGYLNMVEYTDNRMTIWTGLKTSEAEIIKKLLATGLLQEVKLLSSVKDSSKPDFQLYNLSIIIRARQLGGAS